MMLLLLNVSSNLTFTLHNIFIAANRGIFIHLCNILPNELKLTDSFYFTEQRYSYATRLIFLKE